MTTDAIAALWGPLDGTMLRVPNYGSYRRKALVVLEREGTFITRVAQLVNGDDLPKRYRHDPAVRGYYSRVVQHYGTPRQRDICRWQAKRLTVKEMRALGYRAGSFNDVAFGKEQTPGWQQNGSDIDDADGRHDSAEDWKRS